MEKLLVREIEERFPMNSNDSLEILHYAMNRNLQLIHNNACITRIDKIDIGFLFNISIQDDSKIYYAVYVYEKFRGQGLYEKYVKDNGLTIFTIADCNVENYLKKKNIPHVVGAKFLSDPCYKAIEKEYGNGRANRSRAYFMNHIDEGLYVLASLGVDSLDTKKAYCIHPIFQSNEALQKNSMLAEAVDSRALLLAMEYRKTANAYLSKRKINSIEEIELSPLEEVNNMLKADKIQNYKDFLKYHKGKHERSEELDEYFQNWFKRLGIFEESDYLISQLNHFESSNNLLAINLRR